MDTRHGGENAGRLIPPGPLRGMAAPPLEKRRPIAQYPSHRKQHVFYIVRIAIGGSRAAALGHRGNG
jgi:hypothetical protein